MSSRTLLSDHVDVVEWGVKVRTSNAEECVMKWLCVLCKVGLLCEQLSEGIVNSHFEILTAFLLNQAKKC